MTRLLAVLAALTVIAGCKGETKYKDNPDTLERLKRAETESGERQKRIKVLEGQVAELKNDSGGDVVIEITGDGTLKITGKGPHGRVAKNDPKGNAKDAQLYKAFLKHVNGSRGSIKKCYQQALKKDSSLEARPITVTVSVKYRSSGKIGKVSLDRGISSAFKRCMNGVATRWALPPAPAGYTFKAPVTLMPK